MVGRSFGHVVGRSYGHTVIRPVDEGDERSLRATTGETNARDEGDDGNERTHRAMASTVGMMDPAFFVGRKEIISWVNALLGLNLTRVEQCASGAVYCQIMDACHGGAVPMHKVNFEAKSEHEFVNNYKVLQLVFEKLKIARHVEVNRLVKGRPLDNLEFLQWLKCYHEKTIGIGASDGSYDAEERRGLARGGTAFVGAKKATVMNGDGRGGFSARSSRDDGARGKTERNGGGPRPIGFVRESANGVGAAASNVAASMAMASGRSTTGLSAATTVGTAATSAQVQELTETNTSLSLQVERAEQEREFYFEKLQDVEYLCQRPEFENNPLTKVVERILYHTDGKADVDAIIAECFGSMTTTTSMATQEEEEIEEGDEEETTLTQSTPMAAVTAAALAAMTLERSDSVNTVSPLGTPPPMFDDVPPIGGIPLFTPPVCKSPVLHAAGAARTPLQDKRTNAGQHF